MERVPYPAQYGRKRIEYSDREGIMNTRFYVELDKNEDVRFPSLPEEHERLFRRYIEESRHFYETMQLYRMMRFNLSEIFSYYELNFDDTILAKIGGTVDILAVNALLGNAVSTAHTLIESMEIYDKVYVSDEALFKKYYISKCYDEYFTYRFTGFLRNYMQHGHIPVSYDGKRIFFQLSEILEVSHLKINRHLRSQLEVVEQELTDYNVKESRLAVVPVLYEYFLLIHRLAIEFLRFVKPYFIEHAGEVRKILSENPDYMVNCQGEKFVGVYPDGRNSMHGFYVPDSVEEEIDAQIGYVQAEADQYAGSNGNLFFLYITYFLEYRMPVMRMIGDEDLVRNLEEYCLESGESIHCLSFETYYGKSQMHAACRLYPYIRFEDGVQWNVPYQKVSIADFLRTFPDVREKGLQASANNIGGAGELFETLLQDWGTYIIYAKDFLENAGIYSVADAIDWVSRIAFVYQGIKWVKNSFSPEKKHKPRVKDLRRYIRQKKTWNIKELAADLHAVPELLGLVLKESGYVCKDGIHYEYDEKLSAESEQARRQHLSKADECHGTNVNCHAMNEAVEQLNADLLYWAVLKMEQDRLEEYDQEVQKVLLPLRKYRSFLYWDADSRCVRIPQVLPEDFCGADEREIWSCVEEIRTGLERMF